MRKCIFITNHTCHNCLLENSHLENPSSYRSPLARKSEPVLKLYGERLKIYPLGITFDSEVTFQKHFEEILGHCNTRYHHVRVIVNKKWGPSPSTILQIYKQCVRPIFEYGSPSTITTSDTITSKIQRLQNKLIRLALRLPKYISYYMTRLAFHTLKIGFSLVQLGHWKGFPRIL